MGDKTSSSRFAPVANRRGSLHFSTENKPWPSRQGRAVIPAAGRKAQSCSATPSSSNSSALMVTSSASRSVAEKLVLNALAGDTTAIKEIADRIDGKVPQAVVGDEENPISLIHRIERVIVDSSANPDSAGVPPAPEAG
jgi:hypothetical protein